MSGSCAERSLEEPQSLKEAVQPAEIKLSKLAQGRLHIFIFFYGKPPKTAIEEALESDDNKNSPAYSRKWVLAQEYIDEARMHTIGYFTESCELMVEITGGVDTWKKATQAEKKRAITEQFDECPMTIAKNAFEIEHRTVDFEGIFASQSEEAVKWQEVVRSKFINMALKTIEFVVLAKDESRLLQLAGKCNLRRFWEHEHMQQPEISALGFTFYDVPTRGPPSPESS